MECPDEIPIAETTQCYGFGLLGYQVIIYKVGVLIGNNRCKMKDRIGSVDDIVEFVVLAVTVCNKEVLTADLLNILSDILTGLYAMVILLFRFGGLFVYEKDEQTETE